MIISNQKPYIQETKHKSYINDDETIDILTTVLKNVVFGQ